MLAGAVILPTICLLWFMTQAVKNVQLAARQILIDEYTERLDEHTKAIDKIWERRLTTLQGIKDVNVFEVFETLVSDVEKADGAVIYNDDGNITYPIIVTEPFAESNLPEDFQRAWQLEFVDKDYDGAIQIYSRLAGLHENDQDKYLLRKAVISIARCNLKAGDTHKAIGQYENAGWGRTRANMSAYEASLCAQARIMNVRLVNVDPNSGSALGRLASTAITYGTGIDSFLPMDSAARIFILSETVRLGENDYKYIPTIEKAKLFLSAELLSAKAAQLYQNDRQLKQWTDKSLHKLESVDIYATYQEGEGRNRLLLWSEETLKKDFEIFEQSFVDSDILFRIIDNKGEYFSGIKGTEANAFLTLPVSVNLPDWHIELFFANNNVFKKAANKQVAIYIWAGVLVIGLILISGTIAGGTISRQMKMNKLKNDFIATVTHELKTPLASMRVLADTLLEGNYNDQKQAREYMQLICKENKRLTGLIDNFLTFSRMERNKKVFEFEKVSPAEIAKSAIEAVQTKFSQKNCIFSVTIGEDLAFISVDKDAIVTVLVNLLDNAYKYSYDNKKIELKVFSEDKNVCFVVKDNGIGMTRRQMRKIFDRFYQADNTLSRRAEGTGLGLSIVKFILDAHNAKIEVQSQIEKGSTFTVKIPTAAK